VRASLKSSAVGIVLSLAGLFLPAEKNPVPPGREIPGGTLLRDVTICRAGGLGIEEVMTADGARIRFKPRLPLFSCLLDQKPSSSLEAGVSAGSRSTFAGGPAVFVAPEEGFSPGVKLRVVFENLSPAKIRLENVVPLGEGPDRAYITAEGPLDGPNYLSRSFLYRPGRMPVGVVLPDNAWHLGFCDLETGTEDIFLTALARRGKADRAEVRRWFTDLEPGGSVEYAVHIDAHRGGGWHKGLEMMFRERFLHDLDRFDVSLFSRPDLQWIRRAYIMFLRFAWDHAYYDASDGGYAFDRSLFAHDGLLGGIDIFTLWPTWPRLGLDERNQWDMYRDLPGGLTELRRQVDLAHRGSRKYFIAYNPWDESTRREDHLAGMETMLRALDADGIVLDTRGESSREFQETADRVRPGIIMYSEGMAVPKDMPGILAGRVHDALFMPPPLNLNKFIKPDFAIFRVIQLAEGHFHREAAVAFFNGYGVEINTMRPGRPDWIEEEFRYLGRTTKILRENCSAFCAPDWTPLVPAAEDGIWVNRWPAPIMEDSPPASRQTAGALLPRSRRPAGIPTPSSGTRRKIIYTIFSLKPDGCGGPIIEAVPEAGFHWVSLWNHEELSLEERGGKTYVPADVEGFSRSWLGTRREGNVDCLARLPVLLEVELDRDRLTVGLDPAAATRPGMRPTARILVTAGDPFYGAKSVEFDAEKRDLSLYETFGRRGNKFVTQLFSGTELLDERIVRVRPGLPRRMPGTEKSLSAKVPPPGMVEIPRGVFEYSTAGNPDDANPVIPYPDAEKKRVLRMARYFMDKYPVTNEQFKEFLEAARYVPEDGTNFLKHWENGRPPAGLEKHPVVYVGLEDARAYARWAGKRLPAEVEWQFAAQGSDGRKYPWGDDFNAVRANVRLNHTTAVDAFPAGASPFGVMDMVGNVWQLMDDVYDNGAYYFAIIRGGSFYAPETSVWYVKSGPLAVDRVQILPLLAPGIDRCSTVGFRCVKDAD